MVYNYGASTKKSANGSSSLADQTMNVLLSNKENFDNLYLYYNKFKQNNDIRIFEMKFKKLRLFLSLPLR